ncbi:MAG: flagellar assembly protein FliW [Firmicutes bacterium]|nr:flagellar assembly protein FliW [Bacillota bacterium]MDH7496665.1 flagellar assembly protein FliW [Bacillota bacterium]
MRIVFDEGILGFEDVREYDLIESDDPGPFRWLRATSGDLAFIVVDPSVFWPDYDPDLGKACPDLGVTGRDEVLLYVIVTVPDDPLLATANLFAPIVVNARTGKGRQVPLRESGFPLAACVFPENIRQGKVGLTDACPDAQKR